MGVTEEEVNGVLKEAIPDMRILGFEEEERRLRQKKLSNTSIKLPQGPYIFCDFRTLQIPGIVVSLCYNFTSSNGILRCPYKVTSRCLLMHS